MKKIIFTLFILLSVCVSKGQVTNVCASDSITLTVDNYVSGIVEWQESIDNINWNNIPDISGILYKFHPTQSKYYRAAVITSGCDPLYSAVSFVQLPPTAHAGEDRVIGNASVTLLGNNVLGATGKWTILSGSGGSLDDSTKPSAILTGKDKETYQLKWTLTNSCGQSSDTVMIAFNGIIVRKNFIVVDNTDKLLSDSTEMSTGTYRIKFSDPAIAPYDSVMLIGMRQDYSFLRRVTGFTQKDTVFTFSTVQGSLEDLIQSGVLNLGDAINQVMIGDTSHFKNSAVFPTRETLKNRSNKNGFELIYSTPLNDKNNLPFKSSASSINPGGFQLTLPDKTYTDNTGIVKLSFKDSYIKVVPNFVFDYTYKFPYSFTNLKFGIDNGIFEYNYKTVLEGSVQHDFINDDITMGDFRLDMVGAVFALPVWVTIHFKVKASCNIGVSASLKLEQTKNYKKYLTALVTGDNTKNLSFNSNSNDETIVEEKMDVKGELNAELKIGPEISFDLYSIPGPFINLPLKISTGICANANGNWDSETSFGLDGNMGAKAEVKVWGVGFTLFDFNYPLITNLKMGNYIMPYHLDVLSGNFQSGTAGSKLSKPISLKVTNNHGNGIPLVPVRFELDADNGSVADQVILTDGQGIVNVDWTLGIKPQNTLRVRVLDCSNSDIDNSPQIISANSTTTTYDCTNSNLFIAQKSALGNTYPEVSGGKPPYTYSTNGIDYSAVAPKFPDNIPVKKLVYVKDNNQCVRTKTINVNPLDPCANSTLYLEALIQPDILTLTGKLGTAPYTYSVDNATSFTGTKIYSKLSVGKHIAYVKDALGCIFSKEIVIDPQTTNSIKASYPEPSATTVPVSGITFKWVAGSYATNQVYDLYLKKDNAAYSLIASDLNSTSFAYSTLLANNANYTWKVAVKGSNGVIDFSEFTFTTANGVAVTPTVPILLQPVNTATLVSVPVTIKWTSQTGDFVYDIYMDTSDGSKLVALNIASTEYVVNNLESNKKYYWKVKIKSTVTGQSVISDVWSFKTAPIGSTTGLFTDSRDYKTYRWIKIGTQTWMAENLAYLPSVSPSSVESDTSPNYYVYGYEGNSVVEAKTKLNYILYGALYNIEAAKAACPTGWHLASDAEWKVLEKSLGMADIDLTQFGYRSTGAVGGKLKEVGTDHWIIQNPGATNITGFSALPGGGKMFSSGFTGIGTNAFFWSLSTDVPLGSAYRNILNATDDVIRGSNNYRYGLSVRCIKDEINTQPVITTASVSNITAYSATMGGDISSDGGSSIISRGVCWNTSPNPTTANSTVYDGQGIGSFSSSISGLTPNKTYYVRAYATNIIGTYYGNEVTFTTSASSAEGTVTDIDGNVYHTVTIGTQVWMVENLKTTKYRNGVQIPNITDSAQWVNATTGAYCNFNNDANNATTKGRLYNGYAVIDNRNIAPIGWHIPTDTEWTTLSNYLGGEWSAGKSMKSTTGWPLATGTNISGFTALPAGNRSTGTFYFITQLTNIWSSNMGTCWNIFWDSDQFSKGGGPISSGFSVRCIKD